MSNAPTAATDDAESRDASRPRHSEDTLLESLGYKRQLDRGVGRFGSFSVAFALISVTTAVYTTFGLGLTTAGPSFIWTFPIAIIILGLWVLIAADLSSKLPLAGYAYQWTSRLVSPHLGWFTGFFGVLGFVTGMTGVSYTLAGYLAGLLGWNLSVPGTVALTIVILAVAAAVNVLGVRVVTRLNNMGVTLELIVALGGTMAIAVAAFFINHNAQPFSLLFSRGVLPSDGFGFAWITSTVTGLFGLIGVEASADISEETKKATSTVPRMMFLALGTACVVEFIMYGISLLAIQDFATATESPAPLIYVMQTQLGPVFTDVFIAFALTNLLLCVLANLLVAGRLIFSMGRDHMLPKSNWFAKIGENKVPRNAVIACALIAVIFVLTALFNETVLSYILGVSTITFFMVYALTAGGMILRGSKGFPADIPGGFTLGRWRRPVWVLGFVAFLTVVVAFSGLPGFQNNGVALVVFIALATLWYFIGVRPRLRNRQAGPPTMRVVSDARPDGR
ncbi:MAG: APC family permease [Marmoricola sp.]